MIERTQHQAEILEFGLIVLLLGNLRQSQNAGCVMRINGQRLLKFCFSLLQFAQIQLC